jgi:hypothetical protein
MNNWTSIKKQLPEEGDVVLLVVKSYVRPSIGYYEDGEYWLEDSQEPLSDSGLKVTHWQPLPELPTK